MTLLLALLEFLLLGLFPTELVPEPGSLVLLAALGAALALHVLCGIGPWPAADAASTVARAMRRRSERLPVLTLCDPDAAGRPRPRAPGAALPAAR
ncbi:DUF6412 domain-containing protein [Nocardiopsis sp. EMB25]|uniref:DUF6412 domain-containing protein n=1 Tax=Nocardiopsis sp. EMB25 TaxID=2835867 RepID=UPI00228467F6|nr:DUF6412 domain-containing protein [Nocardiopsis sp. EMB25]MCY9786254.1 DUF6412 domain-containing protein [Nocardiopsis sp. EMB25]